MSMECKFCSQKVACSLSELNFTFVMLLFSFVIFSSPFIHLPLDMDSHHFHLFSSHRRGIFSASQCNFFSTLIPLLLIILSCITLNYSSSFLAFTAFRCL